MRGIVSMCAAGFAWFLVVAALLLPLPAAAVECTGLSRLEASLDICRFTLETDRDRYAYSLSGATRTSPAPAELEALARERLDAALSACDTLQCVRDAYWQEVQWLDAYVPPPIDTAPAFAEDRFAEEAVAVPAPEPLPSAVAQSPWDDGSEAVAGPWAPETPAEPPAVHGSAVKAAVVAEPATSPTEVVSHAPADPPGQPGEPDDWQAQLLVLALWGLLAAVVLVLVLGVTNRVVIFYDSADAWWSIAPFLSLVIGYAVTRSLAPSEDAAFASTLAEKAVMVIALSVACLAAVVNYRNAIRHNRSFVLGVIVGTLKLAIALFMAVTVVGQLSRIMNGNSTRRQVSGALLILAAIGFLWHALVNGRRVHQRRGWIGSPKADRGSRPATHNQPRETPMPEVTKITWTKFYMNLGFDASEDARALWDGDRVLSPDAHNINSDGSSAPQVQATVVHGEGERILAWGLDILLDDELTSLSSFDTPIPDQSDDLDVEEDLERSLWKTLRDRIGGKLVFAADDLSYLIGQPDGDIVDSDSFWSTNGETIRFFEDDDVIDRIENGIEGGTAMLVLIQTWASMNGGELPSPPTDTDSLDDFLSSEEFATEDTTQLYLAEGDDD